MRRPGPSTAIGFSTKACTPFLDGIGQVKRPEARGRGQEHEINLIDHVFICIKSGILAILGHVDPRADRLILECGEVLLEPIREGVGHGDELGVGVGGEGLLGRAAASTAAAHQTDLDRAAAGGMDQGDGQAGR